MTDIIGLAKGFKTSEFFYTLVGVGSAIAVSLGYISPEVQEHVVAGANMEQFVDTENINSIIDGIMKVAALVMGGNIISGYAKSRGQAKGQSVQSPELKVNENKAVYKNDSYN